ncbi:MAG TPA: prepilin peptidase [Candidatus Saccharimonadales bacterium]|nr:prepilin peptidase [Candidatus Saccharimonadales bacterium]
MIIAALVILGLCFGSFVNALVWRMHEQSKRRPKKHVISSAGERSYLFKNRISPLHWRSGRDDKRDELSVLHGRSMCPHCHHELAAKDLVPVLSWLWLRGKCRYCRQPISWQYPLVELATAAVFVGSYAWWPTAILERHGQCPTPLLFQNASWQNDATFVVWLAALVGLMALIVYDLRWLLLPNRLVYPLGAAALIMAGLRLSVFDFQLTTWLNLLAAVLIGGGLFYALFQVSAGKWIGGGDVRLGFVLGLLVATPARAFLLLFVAALGGSLISIPLLASGRLKRSSVIPFGPFLIIAAYVTYLFGTAIIHWYSHSLAGV